MGQAKKRGTYDERVKQSIADKKPAALKPPVDVGVPRKEVMLNAAFTLALTQMGMDCSYPR